LTIKSIKKEKVGKKVARLGWVLADPELDGSELAELLAHLTLTNQFISWSRLENIIFTDRC
jgi:hypothetical protein